MSKMKLFGHMWIARNLTETEIRKLCGFLALGLPNLDAYQNSMEVTPVDESAISRMEVPDMPIVKMAKKDHVNSFFEEGKLQLSSFEYYSRHDHGEIGDRLEGDVILLAERENFTTAGRFAGGFDHYLFCTYLGDPNPETLAKFEYDSGFIIRDPAGFATAIQRALGAKIHEYASCVYSSHKALRGKVQPGFTIDRIDHHTIEMVSSARHFVKPDHFSHQREFRFTWQMPHDVSEPFIITCPEAIQYCDRLPS
ncbi:hypothetical protein [Halomonas sp. Y3]|uniref:hypothetical protein n=1 Tax=Halomonas sp. Y3 TaxID=2956797 RepID=UPI0020A1C349|nr:hypothetical protein [Halomonas sp. Y3]